MIEDRISALTSAIEKLTIVISSTFAPRAGAESGTLQAIAPAPADATGTVAGNTAESNAVQPAATELQPKRTRRTKEQIAADNAAKAATAPAGNEPAATHAAGLNEIRDLAQSVLDAGKIEELRAAYKTHGAKDLGTLSPDKYASFIAALEGLLAAPAEDALEEHARQENAMQDSGETPAAKPVTIEDIAALGSELVAKGLVAKVKDVLVKFDIPKLSPSKADPNVKIAKLGNTPPDKFAAVHAALAKALAESSEEV